LRECLNLRLQAIPVPGSSKILEMVTVFACLAPHSNAIALHMVTSRGCTARKDRVSLLDVRPYILRSPNSDESAIALDVRGLPRLLLTDMEGARASEFLPPAKRSVIPPTSAIPLTIGGNGMVLCSSLVA